MKTLAWIIGTWLALMSSSAWSSIEIEGAGSSLSGSLISNLAQDYQSKHDTLVSYKPLGSGQGIRLLTGRVNDFALTDVALSRYETDLLGLVQFPLFFSGITPIVNLPGLAPNQLVLDGETLASIFLGDIKRWTDPKIVKLNPQLVIADLPITTITRADSSGTSYIFTGYLSNQSQKWRETLGKSSKLTWTTGKSVEGTTQVIQAVQGMAGSIGYVEFGAAQRAQVSTVRLQVGDEVKTASFKGIELASQQFTWRQGSLYGISPANLSGPMWPIVGVTYALIPKFNSQDLEAKETIAFFNWLIGHKSSTFEDSLMVPIQDSGLIDQIKKKLYDLSRLKR